MAFIEVNDHLLVNVEEIMALENIVPGGQVMTLTGGKIVQISDSEASKVKKLLKDRKLVLSMGT